MDRDIRTPLQNSYAETGVQYRLEKIIRHDRFECSIQVFRRLAVLEAEQVGIKSKLNLPTRKFILMKIRIQKEVKMW